MQTRLSFTFRRKVRDKGRGGGSGLENLAALGDVQQFAEGEDAGPAAASFLEGMDDYRPCALRGGPSKISFYSRELSG